VFLAFLLPLVHLDRDRWRDPDSPRGLLQQNQRLSTPAARSRHGRHLGRVL